MFTCCPHCKTCFRITKAQLAVAQGKVRCGTCSQIFNAREHLHETLPTRQPADSRPPPASAPTPPAKRSATPSTTPPRATPASPPAASARTDNPASSGPDLDLFAFPAAETAPAEAPPPAEDAQDDGFAAPDAETEDTAVIEMGDDWDALNLEETPEEPREPVSAEFHTPVHDPVPAPAESDDTEIDLFDDHEEPEAGEDTAVIDLTHAPDPFAPHAGVPMDTPRDGEDEDEDAFLFDGEEEDDDTAVIDMRGEDALLAGLVEPEETAPEPADTPPAATPSPDTPAIPEPQDAAAESEPLFAPEDLFRESTRPPADKAATEEPEPPEAAAAETEPAPITVPDPERYTYVDPEDLQPEEKNIDEIIAEMNAQLAEDTDAQMPGETAEPPAQPDAEKPGQATGDDFESSFLASLDNALSEPLPASRPTEKAPPAPRPEAVKPAEVLDLIDPASQLNEGMMPEEEEVPLALREQLVSEGPSRHPLRFGLQILAVLFLLATLGLQLAVFRSTELANAAPSLQPLLTLICSRLPCQYHGPVAVEQIQLVSRDIRDHPREPGALLIQATLVNRAPFAQPFPDMEITLSDLGGAVVASRRFRPREYLGSYWHPFVLMRPEQPVRVTLEVLNPGQDAVNFEFRFLPSTGAQAVLP